MKPLDGQRSYELTPSQQLTIMNRQFAIKRSIVNIPTSIIVEEDLDLGLLEVALRLAVQRWDMFGLRVFKVGKQWRQYFGERDVLCLRRVDFRGRKTSQMNRFFAREGSRTLPLVNEPLAKLFIVITPEGHPGIFSVMNHLIADSWAISSFYKDVFDVYRALASGSALPKSPQSFEPVLVAELAYQESARFEADRQYWQREISGELPFYTSILGSKVLENYRKRTRRPEARNSSTIFLRQAAKHTVRLVPASDVAACQAFLEAQRFPSMQLLFHLALRVFLAAVNGRAPDVTIMTTVARRGTLAEKRSGGCRVQSFTFRSILDEESTFAEALDSLLTTQNSHFRHADFPFWEYSKMYHREYGTRPGDLFYGLMLTFQTVSLTPAGDARFHTMWHCNGASAVDCYLTIMDDDGSGALRCYWEHRTARVKTKDIDATHSAMLRVLRAGIANPQLTIGQLMDLVPPIN